MAGWVQGRWVGLWLLLKRPSACEGSRHEVIAGRGSVGPAMLVRDEQHERAPDSAGGSMLNI